jgi:glutathione S-transferase
VERALQLKGIGYRRVDLPPVAHKAVLQALFGGATVPGLVLDGKKVHGSRAILRALEERVAEPRLLPAGEKERKAMGLAEEWGDEVLQPLVRRVLWCALGREPGAMPSYSEGSGLAIPGAVARVSAPLIARAEQRINRAGDLDVRADLAHLDHHLARVDRWIEHGVIGGEQPNAADLQIGAGLRLLLTVGDVAAVAGSRPATQMAFKWFPKYPGRVPSGVLPAEWLG